LVVKNGSNAFAFTSGAMPTPVPDAVLICACYPAYTVLALIRRRIKDTPK
jgi:hypothetical protein